MGTAPFIETTWTDRALEQAYRHICDERGHESGYSYSGTIANTYGVAQPFPNVMTESGADLISKLVIDEDYRADPRMVPYKGGDAIALQLRGDDAFSFATTTATFDLDALRASVRSTYADDSEYLASALAALDRHTENHLYGFALREALKAAGSLNRLHNVDITFEPKRAVVTTRAEGRARTVYSVAEGGRILETFDTRPAARKRLMEIMETSRHDTMGIRTDKKYDNLPVGVVEQVERRTVSAKIKLTITTATYADSPTCTAKRGWLFYGLAPC